MAFLAAIPAAIGSGISSLIGGAGLSLGSVVSAAGTVISGIGAYGAAQYQKKVAEQNAQIAQDNASKASQQAQQAAQNNDNQIAAFIGSQEAAQSASGLSTTGRSALLTRKAAARIGRADTANIIQQGRAQSEGFMQQSADFKGQAQQAGAAGIFGLAQGVLGGASSLIGASSPVKSTTANRFRNDPWNPRGGPNYRRLAVNTI